MSHCCRTRSRLDHRYGANARFKGGIFYQLKNGCNWGDLAKDLPPDSTVFWYLHSVAGHWSFRSNHGSTPWQSARTSPKKQKWTTLIMIDSQAVKNTCNASIASKGFCHYKTTNGIKRHLAVDTLGFPFLTDCTPANVTDDQGLVEMQCSILPISKPNL